LTSFFFVSISLNELITGSDEELTPEAKQFFIYDKNENVTKNQKKIKKT